MICEARRGRGILLDYYYNNKNAISMEKNVKFNNVFARFECIYYFISLLLFHLPFRISIVEYFSQP